MYRYYRCPKACSSLIPCDAAEKLSRRTLPRRRRRRTGDHPGVGGRRQPRGYEVDRDSFPNRVIVGIETFPTRSTSCGGSSQDNPHVIGDFTWTGWDYLGEAGIGRRRPPPTTPTARPASAPRIRGCSRWCGDIDITGHRRPASYYREIVFGLRTDPYLAVQRPRAARPRAVGHPVGVDATPSAAGPGPAPRARRSPSRSTATPTRSSCCWTAARSARAGGGGEPLPGRVRGDATRRASSSPSPAPAARRPAASRCGRRPARSRLARRRRPGR